MSTYFTEVFDRDDHRCVYCGRWMLADFDTFMLTVEDHLQPLSAGGADDASNRVTACHVCNMLKGKYSPENKKLPKSRDARIQALREYIAGRRAEKIKAFFSWTATRQGRIEVPEASSATELAATPGND